MSADLIVFGPGDLYTSIFPNLLVPGIVDALQATKAKKVFLVNLMTKLGQTDGFKASDFVDEMERYAGCAMDYIFINSTKPPEELLEWYKKSGSVEFIKDDLKSSKYPKAKILRLDLLSDTRYEQSIADRIKRSLIRHDPDKVSKTISELLPSDL